MVGAGGHFTSVSLPLDGIQYMILTRKEAATSVAIGDAAARADTKLSGRQAVVANTVLAIGELADAASGTSGRSQMEATAAATANEGVGADSKDCKGDEVLHGVEQRMGYR